MRNTRFFTVLTVGCLLPFSLSAQSVTIRVPQPAIKVAPVLPLEFHLPSVFPMALDDSDRDLPVQEQESIQKSFSMAGVQDRSLEIDNVWGSIEVVGTNSEQAQLTVKKSIRAESKEKLEQARKEVILDITEQAGSLKLYVNGPFRCNCDEGCGRRREFEGYIVKMDFQLRVPRDIDIKVKTVNEGRVVVRDINGSFFVRNVNGDVEMDNITGSGSAHTVNGPVKVSFRQNPRENSDFHTINGDIDLRFAKGLAADFRFKTFNGSIYSDFPVTALPVHAIQEEHHGAKVVFHADRYTGVRVNSGGPEIKVENLNGEIRILENHE
jgi:putative adhesin